MHAWAELLLAVLAAWLVFAGDSSFAHAAAVVCLTLVAALAALLADAVAAATAALLSMQHKHPAGA